MDGGKEGRREVVVVVVVVVNCVTITRVLAVRLVAQTGDRIYQIGR